MENKTNNMICADLYYGWHECESGIYHSFELQPDGAPVDSDAVSGRLAKLLDTTPDDTNFNWNIMRVSVPLKADPVEAAKQLPPAVLEASFRLKQREYSIEDAKIVLEGEMDEDDEWNLNTYGFTLAEATCENSPHYLCDLIVDWFEAEGTWEISDYTIMRKITCGILRECKEQEAARRAAKAATKPKEHLYFVRAIGKDVYQDFDPEPYEAAMARIQGILENTLKDHPWIEKGGCADIDERDGEFTVTAEEFYQTAYILPVNTAEGAEYILEEIRRTADAADCATMQYQNELSDCGTYDYLSRIRELTDQLKAEMEKEEKA